MREAIAGAMVTTRDGGTVSVTPSVGVAALDLEAPARPGMLALAGDGPVRATEARR
jgi:hypothetical protein